VGLAGSAKSADVIVKVDTFSDSSTFLLAPNGYVDIL